MPFGQGDDAHCRSNVPGVDPARKVGGNLTENWAVLIKKDEMLECDEWATRISSNGLAWSKTNPSHAISNPMTRGFVANTADTDDGLEWPGTDTAHAAVDAEPARGVGVANVRALIDQRSRESAHESVWTIAPF